MYCVAFVPSEHGAKAYRLKTGDTLPLDGMCPLSQSERVELAWNRFDSILLGSRFSGKVILYQYFPGGRVWCHAKSASGGKRRKRRYNAPWITILAVGNCIGQ